MRESDVYLKTTASLNEVATLVRDELGLAIAYQELDGEPFFVGLDGNRRITLGPNEFLEPEYDPIAEYSFELSVDGADDEARLAYARRLFERLRALRQPVLLVDNLVVVDRYEPPSRAA